MKGLVVPEVRGPYLLGSRLGAQQEAAGVGLPLPSELSQRLAALCQERLQGVPAPTQSNANSREWIGKFKQGTSRI